MKLLRASSEHSQNSQECGAKKMLFITSTRIGDAVLSTGILNYLINKNKNISITVVCGPEAAPLFKFVPGLNNLIILNKKPFSLHWPKLWQVCIGNVWDILVDLRRSPISYTVFAKKKFRRGETRSKCHRIEQLGSIVDCKRLPPPPKLWTEELHLKKASELIPGDRAVLAIGPTANWAAKVWKQENFSNLVSRLTSPSGILPGAYIAIFGANNERSAVQSFINNVPEQQRIDLLGKLDLLTVYSCLKRCQLYIGNDSGLMHIASTSGIPTLGLFGPSQDLYYAPWGKHCDIVRTSIPYSELFPPDFNHTTSGSLMDSLSIESVESAANSLWQRTRYKE